MAAFRADTSKLQEVNGRINAALDKMLLQTGESKESQDSFRKMIRLRISQGMKRVAESVNVPTNKSGLQEAVQHGAFKNSIGGTVRITDARRASGGGQRSWMPGTKKHRTVSARTRQINSYYGMQRAFILRMLNSGTDVRTAHADVHGRGTGATWGYRDAIGARGFFDAVTGTFNAESERIAQDIETMAQQVMQEAING